MSELGLKKKKKKIKIKKNKEMGFDLSSKWSAGMHMEMGFDLSSKWTAGMHMHRIMGQLDMKIGGHRGIYIYIHFNRLAHSRRYVDIMGWRFACL